ncbi:extracellular matrix protein 2 [Brachyhypopomus gauderio]|uniref:extracellular matrix protein 2 n=1 Tax=Brachyhypopomus gauderio TaxID=698409 RepID=UPI0040418A4B
MRRVWLCLLCVVVVVGALAVDADPQRVLGGESETDDAAGAPAMEAARTDSSDMTGDRGADGSPGERLFRRAADTQGALGRSQAAWVELQAVMDRRGGFLGKLNMILNQLREEKNRLLGQGEEQLSRKDVIKKDEEEDEDEEDDDNTEEEEDEDEGEEEEEEEGEENENEENDSGNNSTATRDSFTDLLPEECQVGGARISCKEIDMSHFPIITDLSITILELPGNNLTTLPSRGLSGLPNLEEVDLSRNLLDDPSISPSFFTNLTRLKRLTLDGNNLVEIPNLPSSLEELRINDNKINQLLSHSLAGLSKLLILELTGNILYEGSVDPQTFKPLMMLTHLRLDNNRFTSIPSGLPPSLEDLRMAHNQIVEVQDRILNKSVHLRVLDLSYNLLHENSFYPGAWINLPKLEALDLSHNQLSVVPLHMPTVLRQLSLQHNRISTVPAYALSHLRPGLQSLRLSHNQLQEHGLMGKAFRGAYQTLVELLLDGNRLERVPSNIRHFRSLQLLRLDHNQISSVPVRSVCKVKMTGYSPLVAIHLENNYLDVKRIRPAALSCLQDQRRVVLEPQTHGEVL